MKIFLTGATGVVGRRVVALLRDAGHQVTGVARSPQGRAQLARRGATAIALDLFDAAAVRRALQGHEAVVNLATHIPRSTVQLFLPWAWRENDRLRRDASAILVEAAAGAGVSHFVQESYGPTYPDCGDRWIDESTPIEPVRYSRTVADAESAAARFAASGGSAVVLRFDAFYGADAIQTVAMIDAVRRGWVPLPGPPDAFVSVVSHDDAASATAAATALPAGTYNVVDNEPLTHREFAESLATALGVASPRLPPQWITPFFGSLGRMAARSLRISNRKIRNASGWAPRYPSVRDGWPVVVAQLPVRHPQAPRRAA